LTVQPIEACAARGQRSNRFDALGPRDHLAPAQMVPVIIVPSHRRIVLMCWGVIPHAAKDATTADKMIHARVETRTQRPAFRGLLSHHRCLVPSSGYAV
jgi:putative SOS response-associated peptidase YedK